MLYLKELKKLRLQLHSHPELSGQEEYTASRIVDFISRYHPDEVVKNIAGHGLAFVFKGKVEGPVVMFRCELDALPIHEINEFDHRSVYDNVGHKCGHDGHMAILSGVAQVLSKSPPENGNVILLFQPEEETGQGAEKVVNDPAFQALNIDYVFALHNLPGYKKGEIILRKKVFASASKGMIMKLKGKSSHAGEPENGINPAIAAAKIIQSFSGLSKQKKGFNDFKLITIIHARIGERAFGTNPGYGEIMVTLRSYRNDDMDSLSDQAEKIARDIAKEEKLGIDITWVEEFPASVNHNEFVETIEEICSKESYSFMYKDVPFKWSEDFAHFLLNYQGALFGLGSGEKTPQLHNPDYDFPDEITERGVEIFVSIYKKILNQR